MVFYQQAEHVPLGPVPAFQPKNFGWTALHQANLMEIRVLGDNGETVVFGKAPDGEVIGLFEADLFDLR